MASGSQLIYDHNYEICLPNCTLRPELDFTQAFHVDDIEVNKMTDSHEAQDPTLKFWYLKLSLLV